MDPYCNIPRFLVLLLAAFGALQTPDFGCQNRFSRGAVGKPNFWWSGWCTQNRSYKSGGIFEKVSPADLDMVLRDKQILVSRGVADGTDFVHGA